MKPQFTIALAAALAMSQFAATSALAAETVSPASFRSAAPQTFSSADLQRYGLDADSSAKIQDLQSKGYEVRVLSPAEAEKYRGGQMSTTTWWIIGAVVLVAVAVAVAND
jgi:hypothetical protein